MREVFGVTITDNQIAIGGLVVAFLGVAWLVGLAYQIVSNKIRKFEAGRLVSNLGTTTAKSLRSADAVATEYRPVVQAGLTRAIVWLAHHFSFKGRATRKQYILGQMIVGGGLGFALALVLL